jgi:hypothetical protein
MGRECSVLNRRSGLPCARLERPPTIAVAPGSGLRGLGRAKTASETQLAWLSPLSTAASITITSHHSQAQHSTHMSISMMQHAQQVFPQAGRLHAAGRGGSQLQRGAAAVCGTLPGLSKGDTCPMFIARLAAVALPDARSDPRHRSAFLIQASLASNRCTSTTANIQSSRL